MASQRKKKGGTINVIIVLAGFGAGATTITTTITSGHGNTWGTPYEWRMSTYGIFSVLDRLHLLFGRTRGQSNAHAHSGSPANLFASLAISIASLIWINLELVATSVNPETGSSSTAVPSHSHLRAWHLYKYNTGCQYMHWPSNKYMQSASHVDTLAGSTGRPARW